MLFSGMREICGLLGDGGYNKSLETDHMQDDGLEIISYSSRNPSGRNTPTSNWANSSGRSTPSSFDDLMMIENKNQNGDYNLINDPNDANQALQIILNPLPVDGHLFDLTLLYSYISFYKRNYLVCHPIAPFVTNTDLVSSVLQSEFHPSFKTDSELTTTLCIYTAITYGALGQGQGAIAKAWYIKALQIIPQLSGATSTSLAAVLFALETVTWALCVGSHTIVDYYLRPAGAEVLYSRAKSALPESDKTSYIAMRFMIFDLIYTADPCEQQLTKCMAVLESGVDFDQPFDPDTQKEIVLCYFFMSHIMHVFGVIVRFQGQSQGHIAPPNPNSVITISYLLELLKRLDNLLQVNEHSTWSAHLSLSSTTGKPQARSPYWELRMYILSIKYLLLSPCCCDRSEESLVEIDMFISMMEDHYFAGVIVTGPMVLDGLIMSRDWKRSERILKIITGFAESSKIPCLCALVEKCESKIKGAKKIDENQRKMDKIFEVGENCDNRNGNRNRNGNGDGNGNGNGIGEDSNGDGIGRSKGKKKEKRVKEGGVQFQEFITAVDINKGRYTTNTWKYYEPSSKRPRRSINTNMKRK